MTNPARGERTWVLLLGLLLGGGVSLAGGAPMVSFVGFWMGGWIILLLLAPVAGTLIYRWRTARSAAIFVAGSVAGLAPGAWASSRDLDWGEFTFPLFIMALAAFALAPFVARGVAALYVRATRRVSDA